MLESDHQAAGRHFAKTSAANLKFLSILPRVRYRNFKFEAALETSKLLELL
jgi:hypothetical protein